jgi:hypothetical protein
LPDWARPEAAPLVALPALAEPLTPTSNDSTALGATVPLWMPLMLIVATVGGGGALTV